LPLSTGQREKERKKEIEREREKEIEREREKNKERKKEIKKEEIINDEFEKTESRRQSKIKLTLHKKERNMKMIQ
jgi:hypothetical protein